MAKVVKIMTTGTAEGEYKGKSLFPPPCTPHPLLVVEALRRHVGLKHRLQGADIDPHLHGGSDRQHLDAMGLQSMQVFPL
jgi:hypothetical protein